MEITCTLGPPLVPFYPFVGEGSPTKIDYRKTKGFTLILTSLLEKLLGRIWAFWNSDAGDLIGSPQRSDATYVSATVGVPGATTSEPHEICLRFPEVSSVNSSGEDAMFTFNPLQECSTKQSA